jgi:hypothetical protein
METHLASATTIIISGRMEKNAGKSWKKTNRVQWR